MVHHNIILIVLDAVRPDHLDCYNDEQSTQSGSVDTSPTINRIAQEGTVYENAFANSNWTGTSHASMFTGMLPSDNGVYGTNQEIPREIPTLAERLSEEGYATFATSSGINLRSERGYSRGFDRYDEAFQIRPNISYLKKSATDIPSIKQAVFTVTRGHDNYASYKFNSLKRWIDSVESPFFGFINAKTAHHPYNPPRPFKSMFCDELERPPLEIIERIMRKFNKNTQSIPNYDMERIRSLSRDYPIIADEIDPSPDEIEIIKQWYNGAIRYLDERLNNLVDFLEKTNRRKNTTLIITSDHGELFGEHGLGKHRYSLFDSLIRVPLVVDCSACSGERISAPVSLIDLYPTILEIAGADIEPYPHRQSLLPFDEEPSQQDIYAEVGSKAEETVQRRHPDFDGSAFDGPLQSIRSDQYKLIRYPDGKCELYDWREDPEELCDISGEKPEISGELKGRLTENLERMDDDQLQEDIDNPQLKRKLEDLGYI